MKVALYTANFGVRRDAFQDPVEHDDRVDWVYFTDLARHSSQRWKIRSIKLGNLEPRRASRNLKIMAHKFLPEYDAWMWVDANISPTVQVTDLMQNYLHGHWQIAMHKHINRTRLDQELEACIDQGKDDPEVMRAQVRGYLSNGYQEKGDLAETGVILRLNTERVRQFNELWWQEVKTKSVRDQLSVSYALRKSGLDYYPLPENSRHSTLFSYTKHPKK